MTLSLALSLLGGCAENPYSMPEVITGRPESAPPAPAPQSYPPVETPRPAREPSAPAVENSAYRELLAQARSAREHGEYDRSLAYLERAQRIDPDNAGIYLEMARTHDAAGDPNSARSTAERGLLYCDDRAQCDALRAYLD